MVGVEERLAHVEGLVAGHAQLLGDLRTAMTNLELRMERRFDQVMHQIDARDAKIDRLDANIDRLDAKIDQVDARLTARIDALDRRLDEKFRWMFGLQMTIVVMVLASLLSR